MPLNRVFGENFQEEAAVTVLWSNRREYDAVFIFSGGRNLISSVLFAFYNGNDRRIIW